MKYSLSSFLQKQLLIGLTCIVTSHSTTANSDNVRSTKPLANTLKLTTWNIEHLTFPYDKIGCRPRTEQEMSELKRYTEKLNSDVVALQEMGSVAAISQLFPEDTWQIFISDRPDSPPHNCYTSDNKSHQIKVAVAVRRGIVVKNVTSLSEFGQEYNGSRYAIEMVIDSPLGEIKLLNVHMNSGCYVNDYRRSDTQACKSFAGQAPVLDKWIEVQEQSSQPYIVLGDFNHRLAEPNNYLAQALFNNSDSSDSTLENTTAKLIGCHKKYPAPIDHILVGKGEVLNSTYTVSVAHYDNMEPSDMLSDHCAVSLELKAND